MAPFGAHCFPHWPFVQRPSQHWFGLVQGAPFGSHGPAQTPPLQIPVQQSPGAPHTLPAGRQPPHTFPLHFVLQQSPGELHARPFGSHMFLHCPPTQLPEQH